jgi:hypothetical protein
MLGRESGTGALAWRAVWKMSGTGCTKKCVICCSKRNRSMRRKVPGRGRTTWGTNCRPNCVYLEGRKRKESWDDKQTGAKQYRDLVYVDRIEFLDSGGSGNGQRENAESASDETTATHQEMPF